MNQEITLECDLKVFAKQFFQTKRKQYKKQNEGKLCVYTFFKIVCILNYDTSKNMEGKKNLLENITADSQDKDGTILSISQH